MGARFAVVGVGFSIVGFGLVNRVANMNNKREGLGRDAPAMRGEGVGSVCAVGVGVRLAK